MYTTPSIKTGKRAISFVIADASPRIAQSPRTLSTDGTATEIANEPGEAPLNASASRAQRRPVRNWALNASPSQLTLGPFQTV